MKGRWYIDGIDIYARYGVGIVKGGYNDLLLFSEIKTPDANNWHEEDGIEPDLISPKLQNKQVSIAFASVEKNLENDFMNMLAQPGYRAFYIPTLGKTWQLRLSAESDAEMWRVGQKHTLVFYDDDPRKFISVIPPDPAGHGFNLPASVYEMDEISFEQFGIVIEKSRAEVFKMPVIKLNLERDISVIDGKIVSVLSENMSTKDVVLNCCFYCDTIDRFWQNYDAFFGRIIQPGERILYLKETEEEVPCFYRGTSDFNFSTSGSGVVCKFNLVLTFIVYRISETDYLLAAEDGRLIVLEDGETFVDMGVN